MEPARWTFVSYSHHDAEQVRSLIDKLGQAGVDVWFDEHLAPGVDWNEELAHVIEECNVCLFIVSASSLASPVCEREVSFAVRKNRHVIPIYLEEIALNPRLEFEIGNLQAIHAMGRPLTELTKHLQTRITTYLEQPSTSSDVLRHAPQHTPTRMVGRPHGLRTIAVLTTLLLLTAGITYWYVNAIAAPVRIAVLAFENFSGNPNNDYLGLSLAEEVLDGLANVNGLAVLPRTATFHFQGSDTPFKDIVSTLDVDAVLEGSVISRDGNRVRIAAQLIDANDESHAWSNVFDVEMKDILLVKEQITEQIVASLVQQAKPAARTATRPSSRAYDYYLQAKSYLYNATSVQEEAIARDLFAKAYAEDNSFGDALAGQCKAELDIYVDTRATGDYTSAVATCAKATTLQVRSAEVNLALADLNRHAGNCDEAIEIYRQAIEQNEKLEPAFYGMSRCYESAGNFGKAEAALIDGIDIETRNWQAYFGYSGFLYRRGRYAESARQSRTIIDLSPDNGRAWNNLGTVLFAMDDWEEAKGAWEKGLALTPDMYTYVGVATVHYYTGEFDEAVSILEEATAKNPPHYRVHGKLGAAYRELDRSDDSARHFDLAIELGEAALAINPDDVIVLAYLATFYANRARFDDANRAIESALRLAPENPESYYYKAVVNQLRGKETAARDALDRAITLGYSKRLIENDPLFTVRALPADRLPGVSG